jgi:rhodanese-related sulfurtransferase
MARVSQLLSGLSCSLLLASGLAVAQRPAVSPAAVAELQRGAQPPLVLDVRTQAEFDAGHVPGAQLIPHDQLAQRLSELDPDRWVLVYCRSGARATKAEAVLNQAGIEVRQIEGSWLRWEAEARPLETTAPVTP